MRIEVEELIPIKWCEDLVRRCLEEDGVVQKDVTSTSIIDSEANGCFEFRSRGQGVVAGLLVLTQASHVLGDLSLHPNYEDGDCVEGSIATLEGNLRSILAAERTMLNILGHASGVATQTAKFVDALRGTNCDVCDTRKTTPGLRMLDKYAVGCGGGTPHRIGLHDGALFKDNHISKVPIDELESRLGKAIELARDDQGVKFVEVEVDTLKQFEVVLQLPVDIILLDNMSPTMLREAVAMQREAVHHPLLEASGGITIETALEIAQTGVDRIAVGGLVHRSHWLDIGLDAVHE